jgi:hypothetical protein
MSTNETVCLKCNKPVSGHAKYSAADVEASRSATNLNPVCGYYSPLSPSVIGTFKGHDPVPARGYHPANGFPQVGVWNDD